MQSSAASDAPRLPKPPTFSSDSVHISREVAVISSRAPTSPRRASYSTMPPVHNGRMRTHAKGSSDAGSATGIPYRWNSKNSARSSVQYARRSMQSTQRPLTDEHEALDNNNRESMKALSDFLMTREPPLNHFMSTNLSDDEKSLSPFKRSAYKILGRKRKTKEKPQRLLQLPDSAVAAKTISGARHIAISIPIEYDHLQKQPVPHLPPSRQSSQRVGDRSERGAVTVLKPVAEVRESASSYPSRSRSKDGINELAAEIPRLPRVVTTPPVEVMGQENTRTLQNYYSQLNQDRRISAADTASMSRLDPNRTQRSYIAVSPVEISQQETDPRHSGGTAYSTTSIATGQPGHSRGPSTASTTQSMPLISSLKLDLSPRHSNIARIPRYPNMEHTLHPLMQNPITLLPTRGVQGQIERTNSRPKPSTENARGHDRVSSALSGQTGIESVTTVTSFSHSTGSTPSPPTVYTAETAKQYSNADGGLGPQVVRSTTPRAFSGRNPVPRPHTAPPQSRNVPLSHFNETQEMIERISPQREGVCADVRRDRRDRVKAMKKRDVSGSRPNSNGDALQEIVKHNQEDRMRKLDTHTPTRGVITPPSKSQNRRMSSQDLARRRNANSLTGIILVASLPPYPSPPLILKQSPTPTPSIATVYCKPARSLSRSCSKGKEISNSNIDRNRISTVNTPPCSYSSSTGSDSETNNSRSGRVAHVGQSTQSLRSTLLETRRQERRAKRNISLREKELDDRLLKIERDNMILLRTLSGIANSFGELKRLSPQAEKRHRRGVREADEERRLVELERMEPIMRDLQGMAPRVSTESVRQRPEEEGVFDEDDGASILLGSFA